MRKTPIPRYNTLTWKTLFLFWYFILLGLLLPTFGTHLHLHSKTGAATTYSWHPLTFPIHFAIHFVFGTYLRLPLELLLPTMLVSSFVECIFDLFPNYYPRYFSFLFVSCSNIHFYSLISLVLDTTNKLSYRFFLPITDILYFNYYHVTYLSKSSYCYKTDDSFLSFA